MKTLNVIWCQTEGMEEEWIRWLLLDWKVVEWRAPNLDCWQEDSLFVLSSNAHPLDRLPEPFLRGLRGLRRKGLFHLSDEWFCGGYESYREFDWVIRNYWASPFRHPGILVVPLGYANGTAGKGEPLLASRRRFLWAFAGNRNAARVEMVRRLEAVHPQRVHLYGRGLPQSRGLSREEYGALLRETVFCPCPMGNVLLETFRVYEALEAGCVPIVEGRIGLSYFEELMPGHPIPTVTGWREAARMLEGIAENRPALDEIQGRVWAWWQKEKEGVRDRVGEFVRQGLRGAWAASLREGWRFRTGLRHDLWRRIELLRHHSLGAAADRLRRTVAQRGVTILWKGGPAFKQGSDREMVVSRRSGKRSE